MPNDDVIGPRKTMFVLVIVVGCFAVLWPRILSPLVLGPSREQMQPNQFDREAGCCEVIFETDVAILELVNEVCSSALGVGRLSPQSAAECRKAVNDTCGLDIAVFLKRNENVGKTTKMLVETMQNSNSSCLREHFGVPVYNLGPHLAAKSWNIKDTLKQERAPPMRGMGPHPALRERGRAIPPGPPGPPPMPASKPMALPPHVRVRSPLSVYYENEQPPPIPGMRPPLGSPGGPVPAPKSSMGFVMPIYTICIIVFFVYTLSKILFRRTASPYDPITPDPQFRRRVFRDDSRSSPDKLGKKEADTIVTAISGLVAEVQQQMEASNAQNQQRQDVQDNARPYTNGTILLNSGPVQIVASEYKDVKDSKEKTTESVIEKEPTSEPKGTEPIKVAKESSPEQDIPEVPECKEPTVESKESSEVIKSSPETLDQKEATHASVVEESSSEIAMTKLTEPTPESISKEPTPEFVSSAETALELEETIQPVIESVSTSDSNASSISPVYSTSDLKAVKESSPELTSQFTTQTSLDKVKENQEITELPQSISESSDSIQEAGFEHNDSLLESVPQEPSLEPKESSPKSKESSPEPKEPSLGIKETSPVSKEPSRELKESSSDPIEPSPELKESSSDPIEPSPELKEFSPDPKEPSPELKESLLELKEPELKEPLVTTKHSTPEPKEPTPEPTFQAEELIPEPSQAFHEAIKSDSKSDNSVESVESNLILSDPPKSEPEEPIPDPEVQKSSTDLNVTAPEHISPIPDCKYSSVEHKAPSPHKKSTLELTESPQELDAPVERSPEPNVDTGLKEPTSQSKEPTPEPKETNDNKPEVENSIAEGTLLDLDEAIAELDDATSNLQEELGGQNENNTVAPNYDEVDVELMKVFGSGTKDDDKTNESDNFLRNERFTVTKRTTPEHIEDMTGRSFEVLTPTETPAAFKVVGMELTAHAADGGEWPRAQLPPVPAASASPAPSPPARPHEAEEVKSIFLETEIPQQSRVLVAQFEEDRAPDTSDKPRPAKHTPLVVSGKMTLSLIQDAPRETPERDPESTVDEFTTASAVTQPAAEKGELESDEEVDEEIEVEEIEEIEEIEEEEEEEEEEPPSPVKTVRK